MFPYRQPSYKRITSIRTSSNQRESSLLSLQPQMFHVIRLRDRPSTLELFKVPPLNQHLPEPGTHSPNPKSTLKKRLGNHLLKRSITRPRMSMSDMEDTSDQTTNLLPNVYPCSEPVLISVMPSGRYSILISQSRVTAILAGKVHFHLHSILNFNLSDQLRPFLPSPHPSLLPPPLISLF